ncbi:MAG: sialidase family protein [Verrucomicrobia bacterium]|nr:sialidase family protein [Verrucomicrobiota bacterium]
MKQVGGLVLSFLFLGLGAMSVRATVVSSSYGISRQVNVNTSGQNIPGDAANEPSFCIDPIHPEHMAIGWRQFDTTNSNFRQSGVAFTTNGGLNWTFPGNLDPGTFRSDPVLASDADGVFYYLGITNANTFACDLLRSTNGGATWHPVGPALGGDKEWMAIDTTSSPGRGNIYQVWSPFYNVYNNQNQIFTRSTDGGANWMPAMALPHLPFWGTIAIGPDGEVYNFGTAIDIVPFWLNRSTDATNRFSTPTIDVSTVVDLGGAPVMGVAGINPGGLLGQAWVAVDCSTGPTRGNVYVLCSVNNDPGNIVNVMFSRSIDGGRNWSVPLRINDDSPTQHAAHWFGTLSVAPNGRIDACWNDTRHSTNNTFSELYYSWSDDGGLTWAANRPLSPPFNQSLGYPQQNKMGDYIGMVSLNEGACIAYTATFNGEEDIYFVRAELPIQAGVTLVGNVARITWNSTLGVNYCVQTIADPSLPWTSGTNVACLTAVGSTTSVDDPLAGSNGRRYYRVVRIP